MALRCRHMECGAAVIISKVDVVVHVGEVGLDGGEVADGAELEEGASRGELFGGGGEVALGGEDAVAFAAVDGGVKVKGGGEGEGGSGSGFGVFVVVHKKGWHVGGGRLL